MFTTVRLSLTVLAATLFNTVAFAYSMNHDYYSRFRPQFGSNVYVQQQVQYGKTDATVNKSEDTGTVAAQRYSGYVLQTAAGVEHFHCLQTGVFYSNVQQTNIKSSTNDIRGHEAGAELKFVLKSPIANVVAGAGAFYASQVYGTDTTRTNLTGGGYKASVELSYFTSSNLSLTLSGARVVSSLRDSTEKQSVRGLSITSDRVGAGLNIWL